ncbi:MAG: cyclic nucleotide-binding domain-containing protein [Thermoanaerobaculia bacterium]
MLDLAGHLAFALIALSFLVRDVLWLRALSIAASFASISYSYFAPARPLWLVIGWNVVFIALNVVQIGLLLRERRGVTFSEVEKELYQSSFSRFTPVEFLRLIRIATWKEAEAGALLMRAGEEAAEVMLIFSGSVTVEKNGRKLADLRAGDFVGEIGFIKGTRAAASVAVREPTRYVAWEKTSLRSLLDRNPSMALVLNAELTEDMADKLARRTGLTGAFTPPVIPS